ncbi:MAG: DUF6531 domain-containing protein, partial [Planctomycetes bacterium]|nr:DUF6531 domain-containing protein [Planctomycetota bacterium]
MIDGTAFHTFTPTSVNYLTYTTPVFNVSAGVHTITLEGTDPSLQDNTAFITDVQVTPALEQTILNVFQNVYNNIVYEPYAGLQKGPAATQATGAGNDWDQAALLISDLEAAGIPAADLQFVQGRISPAISQINAWLGTVNASDGHPYAAFQVLADAGLNPQTSPNDATITLDHVWVQVTVPGVNNGQPFFLDPSWKMRDYADQNLPAGAGALTLVPYNSTNSGGFLTNTIAAPGPIAMLDGNFNSPDVSPTGTSYDPTGTPWSFTGAAGVTGDDSGLTSGLPPAPDGQTQVGFVQQTGSMAQTDTFAAGNYTLSMLAAQRENYPHGYQELEILIDNNPIYTFSPTTTSYLAYSTPTFTLTAGQHTIEILGLDPNGQDNMALITGVQVNSVLTQTPYQWYEAQVATALAKNYPGLSLSDITHDGPVVAQQFTSIPQTLPYSSYSITGTYSAGPQGNVSADIPTDEMARIQIKVANSSNQSFTYTAVLPESLNGQAIGTSPIVLTYSNPTDTGALIPVLEIGGATVATAGFSLPTGTSTSPSNLTITLDQLQIGQSGPMATDITHQYVHAAGQVIGIGVNVGQWSDSAILNMQAQLNQLSEQVYIDQSFGNVSEAQLNAALDQNLMVGLAAAKYMYYVDSQSHSLAALTGNVWIGDMSSGITYADPLALSSLINLAGDEHWDAADPIFSNLATDMPNINILYVPAALDSSTLDWTAPNMAQVFTLMSDNSSALEAYTVQEMTNSSAISTVTGFQQALEHGYPLITITPAQGDGNITTFGSGTYNDDNLTNLQNELNRWWSGSSPDHATTGVSSSTASVEAQLLQELDNGYSIIAPDTLVVGPDYAAAGGVSTASPDNTYPNVTSGGNRWIGNVWIDQLFSTNGDDRDMMIAPVGAISGHGGYSAGYSIPTAISQPTNTMTNVTTGDPVDPYNGNVYHNETDINIPNPGLPLNFSRTYNSLLATASGSGAYASSGAYGSTGLCGIDVGLGNGWTDSCSGFLSVHAAATTTPAQIIYTSSAGNQIIFMGNSSGGYTARGGVYGVLAKQSDGSFIYTDTTGTQYRFIAGLDAVTGAATASDGGLVYRLSSITDRNGNELLLDYDPTTRFLQEVASARNTARHLLFTWDTTGGTAGYDHITQVGDFTGRTWTYTYATAAIAVASGSDTFNNVTVADLVSVTSPVDVNNDNHVVRYAYINDAVTPADAGSLAGLLTEITDSVTNASTGVTTNLSTYDFNYYPDRRVFSVTDPLGNQERYTYDLVTNQTTYTDELGQATLYEFNAGGLLTTTINPGGNSTTNIWGQPTAANPNAASQLASQTDAAGYITQYFNYDAAGNYTQSISPAGVVTDYAYTTIKGPYEVLSSVTLDPSGLDQTTTYTYDANGNRLSRTDSLGNTTTYTYNSLGEMTSETQPNGHVAGANAAAFTTTYTYDASGQVATTAELVNGANAIATNVYDSLGDLIGSTDFNGNTTTYTYDSLDELLTSMNPVGGKTSYSYYDGQKVSMTDPRGLVTTFIYDLKNELVETINPDGTTSLISCNGLGNVSTRTDENGNTTRYFYNRASRLEDTVNADNGYTLDILNGDGQTLLQTTPLGSAVPYSPAFAAGEDETTADSYNTAGELATNTNALGGQTTYTYDHAGNMLSVTDPNGNTTSYVYNNLNEVIEKLSPTSGGAPALGDSGFESPNMGTGLTAYENMPAGEPWAGSGSAGVSANGTYFTSGNPDAPQGNQVAFIQDTGSLTQSATFGAGDYSLSLYAAQRGNGNNGGQTLEILIDNQVVDTFTPAGINYLNYTTPVFHLAAGSHTITIEGTDPSLQDNTAFIDAVQINPTTTYTYDADGNRTSVTDPNGNTTGYVYNNLNEVIEKLSPPSGGAPALGDSGFESPVLAPRTYVYTPPGTPWTFVDSAGISGNGSGFTSGNPDAPQGNQVAFIQDTGSLTQSATFGTGDYSLSLYAAQRGNGNNGGQTLEILIDNQVVYTFTPAGVNYLTYTTPVFHLAAGSHTITLEGTDPSLQDNTAFIDAVQINPTTMYSYDNNGNVITTTDANGNITTEQYDALNRQIKQVAPTAGGTLADSGFESPVLAPQTYESNPTGTGWTFVGNSGISDNGSGYTSANANAPQGNQVAYIQFGSS